MRRYVFSTGGEQHGSGPFKGFRATPLARPAGDSLTRVERYRRGSRTFVETLKLSLDALRAHKLRSFLTLLGVILAVLDSRRGYERDRRAEPLCSNPGG